MIENVTLEFIGKTLIYMKRPTFFVHVMLAGEWHSHTRPAVFGETDRSWEQITRKRLLHFRIRSGYEIEKKKRVFS